MLIEFQAAPAAAPAQPTLPPASGLRRIALFLLEIPVLLVTGVFLAIMLIAALPVSLVLGISFLKQAIWGEAQDDEPYQD